MVKPLISCAMITGLPGRRELAEKAVESFRRQLYGNKELVIINTSGEEWFADTEENIIELKLPQAALGTLRNQSINAAKGNLVLQWDDDDFHANDRIWKQWEAWEAGRCNILKRQIRCDLETGEAFVISGEGWKCGGIMGTLLLDKRCECYYDRKLAQGEDTELINILSSKGLIDVVNNDPRVYTRFYTGKNTWEREHILKPKTEYTRNLTKFEERHLNCVRWFYNKEKTNPSTIEEVIESTKDIPFMSWDMASFVQELVREYKLKTALEIGHLHGKSTCFFSVLFDSVLTVDILKSSYYTPKLEDFIEQLNLSNVKIVRSEQGSGDVLLDLIANDKTFDCIYVDGNHQAHAVVHDLTLAGRLLNHNGWLLVDDVNNQQYPAVDKAWRELIVKSKDFVNQDRRFNMGIAQKYT